MKTEQGFLVIASPSREGRGNPFTEIAEPVQRLLRDFVPRNDRRGIVLLAMTGKRIFIIRWWATAHEGLYRKYYFAHIPLPASLASASIFPKWAWYLVSGG